jgi:hypothetical protein
LQLSGPQRLLVGRCCRRVAERTCGDSRWKAGLIGSCRGALPVLRCRDVGVTLGRRRRRGDGRRLRFGFSHAHDQYVPTAPSSEPIADPGMEGFCVDGAPVWVPVRLRSAADWPSERTGVNVGNCGEGAGLEDEDFDPKQMARTPLFVVWFAYGKHAARRRHSALPRSANAGVQNVGCCRHCG